MDMIEEIISSDRSASPCEFSWAPQRGEIPALMNGVMESATISRPAPLAGLIHLGLIGLLVSLPR
jgi:hypothetical protein